MCVKPKISRVDSDEGYGEAFAPSTELAGQIPVPCPRGDGSILITDSERGSGSFNCDLFDRGIIMLAVRAGQPNPSG
jgi:hypothetical protein